MAVIRLQAASFSAAVTAEHIIHCVSLGQRYRPWFKKAAHTSMKRAVNNGWNHEATALRPFSGEESFFYWRFFYDIRSHMFPPVYRRRADHAPFAALIFLSGVSPGLPARIAIKKLRYCAAQKACAAQDIQQTMAFSAAASCSSIHPFCDSH